MSVRYYSIRIVHYLATALGQGEMSLIWKAVLVSICLQCVMQPHIVVYILSKVNRLLADFTVNNISFHLSKTALV